MTKLPGSPEPRVASRRIRGTTRGAVVALALGLATPWACSHDWDRDNPSLHPPPDAADDLGTDAPPVIVSCPAAARGPALVGVPSGAPSGGYCIDATEVTRGQYEAFVGTNPATLQLPSACTAGGPPSFAPTSGWPPMGNGDRALPVAFVDWCDAIAFCVWAGKHLCGGIGGAAYATDMTSDPNVSEWYNACSAGGSRQFPYGGAYEPTACNGRDLDAGTAGDASGPGPVAAGSLASCVGGVSGLHDMSGNVFEWENNCLFDTGTPANSTCSYRGGGYASSQDALACTEASSIVIGTSLPTIGFRCCADALTDAGQPGGG